MHTNQRGEEVPRSFEHEQDVITLSLRGDRYPAHISHLKIHCSFFECDFVDFETVLPLPETLTPGGLDLVLCYCYHRAGAFSAASVEDLLDAVWVWDFLGGSRGMMSALNARLVEILMPGPQLSPRQEAALQACLQKIPLLRESVCVVRKARHVVEHVLEGQCNEPWKKIYEKWGWGWGKDWWSRTKKELLAVAAERKLATKKRMRKDELVDILFKADFDDMKKVAEEVCLVSDAVRKMVLQKIEAVHEERLCDWRDLPVGSTFYRMGGDGELFMGQVQAASSWFFTQLELAGLPVGVGDIMMHEIRVGEGFGFNREVLSSNLEKLQSARSLLLDMFSFSDVTGMLRFIENVM